MRNFKKLTLASLALAAVGSFAFGVNTLNAYAEGEETTPVAITSQDIVMDGASVRTVSPNGIRFHTYVNESFKENYTFGTLFLPESMLEEGKELTHENYASAVPVEVSNWQETTGTTCEYTCVLAGEQAEGAFGEYPSSEYGTEIVARSYAQSKTDGSYVYAETSNTRTLVEIASKALADTSEDGKITNETSRKFLAGIVDVALAQDGDASIAVEQGEEITVSDAVNTTLTLTGCDRMVGIWSSDNEDVATVVDGVVTPKAVGEAVLTVFVGSSKAEVVVTVQRSVLDSPVVANGEMTWNTVYGATGYTVKVNGEVKQSGEETSYMFTEEDKPEVYPYDVNVEVVADGVGSAQTLEVCLCGDIHPFNVSTGVENEYYIMEFHNQSAWGQFSSGAWNPVNENVGAFTWGSQVWTGYDNQTRLADGVLRVSSGGTWENSTIKYILPEALDLSTVETLSFRFKCEGHKDDQKHDYVWTGPLMYLSDGTTKINVNFYSNNGSDKNYINWCTRIEEEDGWNTYSVNIKAWRASATTKTIDFDNLTQIWIGDTISASMYYVDWIKYTKVTPKELPEGAKIISYADGDAFTLSSKGSSTVSVVDTTTENGGSGAKFLTGVNKTAWDLGAVTLTFNKSVVVDQTNTDSFAIKFKRSDTEWQDNWMMVSINNSATLRVFSMNTWEILEFNKEFLKNEGITEITSIEVTSSSNAANASVQWFIDSIFWLPDSDVATKYCPEGATLLSGFDNKTGYSYVSREGEGENKYTKIVSSSGSGAYMTYVSLDYNYNRSTFTFDFKDITPEVLAGKTKIGIRYKVVAGSGVNFGICDYEKYGTASHNNWVSATGNQSAGEWKEMTFAFSATTYYEVTKSLSVVIRIDSAKTAVILLDSMWMI